MNELMNEVFLESFYNYILIFIYKNVPNIYADRIAASFLDKSEGCVRKDIGIKTIWFAVLTPNWFTIYLLITMTTHDYHQHPHINLQIRRLNTVVQRHFYFYPHYSFMKGNTENYINLDFNKPFTLQLYCGVTYKNMYLHTYLCYESS